VSPGYRWTLDEYVLRCEHLVGLREVVVEGELDRDFISEALNRWGAEGVAILDADYLEIASKAVEEAGFGPGVKGKLLTLAAALNDQEKTEDVTARIAIVVDRDYDGSSSSEGVLLLTDGYSIENYALNLDTLSRFATQALGRSPLPAGRGGVAPNRRNTCSGEELYSRIMSALVGLAGLRIALRSLDPPVGIFDSWLDYFKISSGGQVEPDVNGLLRNVLTQRNRINKIDEVHARAQDAAMAASRAPERLVRGRDFVEMLAKLLRSSWGRRRGGAVVGKDVGRLARMLVFSVDPDVLDSTGLMQGLRQRFAAG
jgi:hypothetical protein